MKRVVALYRVSSEKQGTEDDIPVQRKECRDYAKQQGWNIVEEILEKISGYHTPIEKREDLKRVRELAANGEIDILLVYYSDRIGRQTEMVGIVSGLMERNVEVYSVKEGKIGGAEHIDTLLTFVKFWQAEGESRKTSERVTDAMKKYNEEGEYMGGTPPYGYTLIDSGEKRNSKKKNTVKKLVIDESEAEIVKLIFDLTIKKNYGAGRISKTLNEKGYKTRKNCLFRSNVVGRILRNPVYMGYKRYNAHQKVNQRGQQMTLLPREEWKIQPFNKELQIISIEDFQKTQEIIDKRKCHKDDRGCNPIRSTGSKYALLSGLVSCHCGARVKTDTRTKRTKRKDGTVHEKLDVMYRCQHRSHVPNHGKSSWGYKGVDRSVENEVKKTIEAINFNLLSSKLNNYEDSHVDHITKELKRIETQLKKKETGLANAENEFEKFMLGESEFTREQISKLLSKLSADVVDLKMQKEELEDKLSKSELSTQDLVAFKEKYINWIPTYEAASHEEKQMMIASVVKEVVLREDGNCDIKFVLGINEAMQNQSISFTLEESDEKELADMPYRKWNRDGELTNPFTYTILQDIIKNKKTYEFVTMIEIS